jgi:hypothetical protein
MPEDELRHLFVATTEQAARRTCESMPTERIREDLKRLQRKMRARAHVTGEASAWLRGWRPGGRETTWGSTRTPRWAGTRPNEFGANVWTEWGGTWGERLGRLVSS